MCVCVSVCASVWGNGPPMSPQCLSFLRRVMNRKLYKNLAQKVFLEGIVLVDLSGVLSPGASICQACF